MTDDAETVMAAVMLSNIDEFNVDKYNPQVRIYFQIILNLTG